jgi:hypothetical protein
VFIVAHFLENRLTLEIGGYQHVAVQAVALVASDLA